MAAYAWAAQSPVLAAKNAGETAVWIAFLGAILIVVVVAGWLLLLWYRRRLLAAPKASAGEKLWSLDELRQLKREGLIGEEEFNRLRARLLDEFRVGGKSGQSAPASPPATNNLDAQHGPDAAAGDNNPPEPPKPEPPSADEAARE